MSTPRRTPVKKIEHDFKEKAKKKLEESRKLAKDKNIAVRRSSRFKPELTSLAIAQQIRYLVEAQYEAADDRRAGGKHSTITLGPGGFVDQNTDADSSLPSAIVKAREEYDIDFKAGHLLNATFGGNGKLAKNLTILTPGANKINQTFDNRIKEAVAALYKAYVAMNALGVKVTDLGYGIALDISTLDTYWDDDYPGNCISNGLICTAEVVEEPDLDELLDTIKENDTGPSDPGDNEQEARKQIQLVADLVETANSFGEVDNTN